MTKVMIIDDDTIVGEIASDALKAAGYSVILCRSGEGAVDLVKANRPDVVLLDIMLPGVDGLMLCKQMREDPSLAGLKIVIVTGKAFAEEKGRAERVGADLFLKKPFDVEALPAQLAALLKK